MKRSFYTTCFLLFTSLILNSLYASSVFTTEGTDLSFVSYVHNEQSSTIDATNEPLGGNQILTLPIPAGQYCRNSTVVVKFETQGAFPAPNTFVAQLSDPNGDFSNPVNIGSVSLSGNDVAGLIFAVLPGAFTSGTGYRIRVISLQTPAFYIDNGTGINLQLLSAPAIPTVNVNGPLQFCFGSASTFLTSSVPNNNLWFPGGVNTQPFLGVVSSGNYYTQITGSNGCVTSSVPVTIQVNTPIFTFLSYLDEEGIIVTTENPQVTICEGDSLPIVILVDGGVAPYQLIYSSDGGQQEVFFIEQASDSTVIYVSEPGVYSVLGLQDSFPTNCGITTGGSSGAVTLTVVPRPEISFSYEPYCGSFSEEPQLSNNWIAGGTFSFVTDPGDGASVDPSSGIISGSVSNATYTITYSVQGPNCEVRDTTTVTVEPSDIVDFTYESFCPGIDNLIPTLAEGFTEGGVFSFDPEPNDGATINPTTGVLSNLIEGNTYIISYTSPDGECQNTGTTTVEPALNPEIDGTVVNALCNDAIGEVNITVSGGVEPYQFSWSNNATTQNINGLEAGTYNVTVTGDNGCFASASFTVENDNEPELIVAAVNATCANNNGSVSVEVVANTGTPDFQFLWSANAGNSTNESVENLAPGTYSVTVTDAAGCEVSGSATISIEDAPELSNIVINPSLCNDATGSVSFEITGTEPITFLWTDGETTQNITNKNAGTYEVTITDGNDCELVQSFTIAFENPVVLTIVEVIQPTCADITAGSIITNTSGGTPEYTYIWNDAAISTTPNLSGLGGGIYKLIVTDAAGCVDSVEASIDTIIPIDIVEEVVNPTCGNEDGSITLNVSGGSGNFTFLWNDNSTDQNRTNLAIGNYSVTITDAENENCTAELGFNLQFEDLPTLEFVSTNTACDVDTASATVTVIGGSGTYTLLWTPGDFTTETITSLAPGTYEVTVLDENGCEASGSVSIVNIDLPIVTATVLNTTCANENGIIDVTVTGGTEPFSILWSNGATTQDLFSLAPGDYSFVLTDAKTCEVTGSYTIAPSIPVEATIISSPSSCAENTGSITVTLLNTTGNIVYNWTKDGEPFATTQNLTGLAAGVYELNAFDAAGCIVLETVTIENSDQPVIVPSVTNASCGASDGEITISVENGSGTFTVLWENGQTTNTISNLEVGCYNVEIFDENGCEASANICIENLEAPELELEITQPSCGTSNGSIQLTINGGTEPFTIEWSNNSADLILENLGEGTYSVTVTDAGGCISTAEATLVESGSEIIVFADIVNSTCGLDDGSISLTISGGVEPYLVEWTGLPPKFNGPILEDVSAGIYEVTITDDAGCFVTQLITVENIVDFEISAVVTEATCGQEDGAIDLTIIGGTGFGLVSWYVVGESEPFAFDEDIENLAPGVYRVIIFEKDGCSDSLDVVVGNIVDFDVTATIEDPSCGSNNGSINIEVEGGTGPYTFLWNDVNASTTQNLVNVPAGTYTLTVTDANDCVDIFVYTIADGPGNVAIAVTSSDASCGECNGSISIEVLEGTEPLSFTWNDGGQGANRTALCAGEYIVTVTDANGCDIMDTITIGDTPALVISSTQENTLCNLATGTATVVIESGTEPYTILWDNNETTATIENLVAGTYNVQVTDANNCQAELAVVIINDNEPILTVTTVNPSCDDANSGEINIIIDNATEPVIVTLNGDVITELNITGLAVGIYVINVSDASGCEVSETVNLINTDAPVGNISLDNDTICLGESTELTIELTGEAPFSLTYFNGFATITVTGIQSNTLEFTVNPTSTTTYSLISLISEANPLCVGTFINNQAVLTVNPVPAAPVITAEGELSICLGDEVILTSDVTEDIVWSPNGETTPVITATDAGVYFVTVTNEFGCTAISNSIEIILNPAPTVSAGADQTICFGEQVQLQATGADAYVWSPSIGLSGTIISNPTASPAVTTTYTVTGTTACGTGVDTITITVLPVILPSLDDVIQVCENAPFTLSVTQVDGATYAWGPASAIVGADNLSTVEVNTAASTEIYVTITNINGCAFSDTANIVIIPAPTAPIIIAESDTIFCDGGSVILTSNLGEGVTWSNGIENVLSILVTTSGTYSATFNDGTCDATSNEITVVVLPKPVAVITPAGPSTICEGDELTLTADLATSYSWVTPTGNFSTQTVNASVAGVYTLVVTNEADCESDSVSTVISVVANPTQPNITLDGPADLCDGDIVNLTTDATGSFNWIINGVQSPLSTPTVSVNAPGTYQVVVTNAAGCTAESAIVEITVKPNLPPNITASSNTIVCGGADVNITLTASAGFSSYVWFPGNSTGASLLVTAPGDYCVTGTNQNGCQASSCIEIIQSAVINAEISSPTFAGGYNISTIGGNDGSINTSVSGGIPEYTYAWSDNSTIVTPNRSNLSAGTYTVVITDAVGCSVELTITLTEPTELEIPNAFTPNGDGFNDRFVVKGLEGYPNNTLTVFNRWGNIVYQQNGYNNDWNGVNNSGDNLPDGTYFIILEVQGLETFNGYVDLRR